MGRRRRRRRGLGIPSPGACPAAGEEEDLGGTFRRPGRGYNELPAARRWRSHDFFGGAGPFVPARDDYYVRDPSARDGTIVVPPSRVYLGGPVRGNPVQVTYITITFTMVYYGIIRGLLLL